MATVRTNPVGAEGIQHPGKGAVEAPGELAGRKNRAAGVEAGKIGRKLQEAETAGVCEQGVGLGGGVVSLRKGAGWGNAHGREPRLGWIVFVDLSTLSEGSFFSSRFKRLPSMHASSSQGELLSRVLPACLGADGHLPCPAAEGSSRTAGCLSVQFIGS